MRGTSLSKGDPFARVTIGKDAQTTPVIEQKTDITPDWKIVHKVKPGKHDVKLELLDKDVSVDDPIDINKVANKRPLEFTRRYAVVPHRRVLAGL